MCVAASDETNLWTRPCNEHADDDDDDEEEEVEEEEVEEGAAAAAAAAATATMDGWPAPLAPRTLLRTLAVRPLFPSALLSFRVNNTGTYQS